MLRKSLNPSAAFPIREFVCRSPYSLVNVLTIGDLAMPQHLSGEMHRKRDSSAFSSKTRTQTKTVFILVVLGRREERNSSSNPLVANAEWGMGGRVAAHVFKMGDIPPSSPPSSAAVDRRR